MPGTFERILRVAVVSLFLVLPLCCLLSEVTSVRLCHRPLRLVVEVRVADWGDFVARCHCSQRFLDFVQGRSFLTGSDSSHCDA